MGAPQAIVVNVLQEKSVYRANAVSPIAMEKPVVPMAAGEFAGYAVQEKSVTSRGSVAHL